MNGWVRILIKKQSTQLCAHLRKQDCYLVWYCDRVGIISEFTLILRRLRSIAAPSLRSLQANRNENKCWNNQLKDHTNSQELFVNSTVKSLFFIQGFYQVEVIQAGLTSSWPLGMNFSLQVKELSYFHTRKMNT